MPTIRSPIRFRMPELVHFQRNGLFVCERDLHNDWCPHIQTMIEEGLEAKPLWDDLAELDEKDDTAPYMIQVPMVMDVHLFLPVQLLPFRLNGSRTVNAVEAKMRPPINSVMAEIEADLMDESLGIFGVGDGIAALRTAVYQTTSSMFTVLPKQQDAYTCRSTAHSYDAQRRWEADMEYSGTHAWQQHLCVALRRACKYCLAHELDLSKMAPTQEKKYDPFTHSRGRR